MRNLNVFQASRGYRLCCFEAERDPSRRRSRPAFAGNEYKGTQTLVCGQLLCVCVMQLQPDLKKAAMGLCSAVAVMWCIPCYAYLVIRFGESNHHTVTLSIIVIFVDHHCRITEKVTETDYRPRVGEM